jgi:uncharacterized protein (DUF4213/DUF364 family)
MALLEDLIGSVRQKDMQVRNIVMGRFWTFVASAHCGIASTILSQGRPDVELACRFGEKRIADLLDRAFSTDLTEASLGVAALNSVLVGQLDASLFTPCRIPRAKDKKIAVVGDFPFIGQLRELADQVWIIEADPATGGFSDTAESLLPEADVAIITGAAIVNRSLERLLGLSKSAYTVVAGPSTPLSPILFRYGANQVRGIRVKDEERLASSIGEGLRDVSESPWIEPVVLGESQQSR